MVRGLADIGYLPEVVRAFGLMAAMLSGCFLLAIGFIGLVHSHRIAGPLYAFQRFFDDALNGKHRRLRLRDGDEFPQLERMASDLVQHLSRYEHGSPKLRAVDDSPPPDREAA
jgi:hypothetical protein